MRSAALLHTFTFPEGSRAMMASGEDCMSAWRGFVGFPRRHLHPFTARDVVEDHDGAEVVRVPFDRRYGDLEVPVPVGGLVRIVRQPAFLDCLDFFRRTVLYCTGSSAGADRPEISRSLSRNMSSTAGLSSATLSRASAKTTPSFMPRMSASSRDFSARRDLCDSFARR